MAHSTIFKKSALAAAIVCSVITLAAQAEDLNDAATQRIVAEFGLGTQSIDAAEAQEREKTQDDIKLSPELYRLKEGKKQAETSLSEQSRRSRRAADAPVELNLDITVAGSVESALGELEAAGFNVAAVYGNSVGGTISADNLEALSQISAVQRIELPERVLNSGLIENQADFVEYSKRVRETLKNAPTGKGVTIGVLSDSFDCIGARNKPGTTPAKVDISNGEVPSDVYIVKEGSQCSSRGGDEGRAMVQLIHDIAPDAKIAFYSPDTMTEFAQAVQTLALPKGQFDASGREGAGANIIVDDERFITEPFYETGIIGESIASVVKKGVSYFTAGGNYTLQDGSGRDTTIYTNRNAQFVPFTPNQNSPTRVTSAQVLKMNNSNATVLPVTVEDIQTTQRIVVWWGQSFKKGSQSKIMACLTRADGTALNGNSWCVTQQQGQSPVALLSFALPKGLSGGSYGVQVFYLSGVKPTDFTILGNRTVSIDPAFATQQGSIYGHSAAPEAFTLAAVDFASTPQCTAGLSAPVIEDFSSRGNSPLFFDGQGKAINLIPNKPDAAAIDGTSTSFFGSWHPLSNQPVFKDPACNQGSSYKFYGTSAAAPNTAAVAALIVQDNPGIKPEQIYNALRQGATPIGKAPASNNYNYTAGYGLINAEKAINALRAAR